VLAQSLRVASHETGDRHAPNSLHAYFIGPGDPAVDVDYTGEVLKAGRSLDLVSVRARQGERTILALTASFHVGEASEQFEESPPKVPAPGDLPGSDYVPPRTNPAVRAPFEVRYTDDRFRDSDPPHPEPHTNVWIRMREPVRSDSAVDHASLLAYAVDFLMTRAAHLPLRRDGRRLSGSSLDHAMWFHRPFRVDEWLLVSSSGVSFAGSRALAACRIFNEQGHLIASAGQEALLRRRDGAP
jgi:acyl-CoA thioesterase-2